jgi:hypothetical protein
MGKSPIRSAAALLAIAAGLWFVGCSHDTVNLAGNDDQMLAESAPELLTEVLVTASAPEPPVLDTVFVTAAGTADIGTTEGKTTEPVEATPAGGAVPGIGMAGLRPVFGHAANHWSGTPDQGLPFQQQRFEP